MHFCFNKQRSHDPYITASGSGSKLYFVQQRSKVKESCLCAHHEGI